MKRHLFASITFALIFAAAAAAECDRVIEISGRAGCVSYRYETENSVSVSFQCGPRAVIQWPNEADGWRAFWWCDPVLFVVTDVIEGGLGVPFAFTKQEFAGCISSNPGAWCEHNDKPGILTLLKCLPPEVPYVICLVPTDPIFADGFESGDTSAWSRVTP